MPERILIVDDDLDTLKLVGLMLQRKGYEIIAASNGQQGLQEAIEKQPDLILLDVMMPGMDGYQVAKLLRQNAETANIPILMFTAKSQLDDKVTGFESGADDYLTKPTHPTELLAHVKALLARSPRRGGGAAAGKRATFLGVMGVHGGWGVTTLAASLASVLAEKGKKKAIFVELQPGRGTIATELSLQEYPYLEDLLALDPPLLTTEKVQSSLVEMRGLNLLLASPQPDNIRFLLEKTATLDRLVNRLESMADYVVLDLGSFWVPPVLDIYKRCQKRLMVLEPIAQSVEYARYALQALSKNGIQSDNVYYVVNNRERSELKLSWMDVQKAIGHPIAANIIPVPELVHQARQRRMLLPELEGSNLFVAQLQKVLQAMELTPKGGSQA
jgi:DNA-binding response OmpR family regulator